MKKLLVILGLFVSTSVFAEQGQLNLLLSGYTDHFGKKTYWNSGKQNSINDSNLGGGLSYEVIDNLTVGVEMLNNSINQSSTLGFVQYDFINYSIVKLGISQQAASGYSTTQYYSRNSSATYGTSNMRYATYLNLCLDTMLSEKHGPQVCAKSPVAQSNGGGAFNQVTFYLEIPLTNLLQD